MFVSGRSGHVKGIVKDFHFESMRGPIKPLVLFSQMTSYGNLLVRVAGNDLGRTISIVESKWKQLVPSLPFEYRFLDDDYLKLYRSEFQLGNVMNLFSVFAIILACLGLFGLSSYTAQRRIKEIGIRKVLGAPLINIVGLIAGKFALLILIAILVASPIAWMMMNNWLNDFAYKIEMPLDVFGWTGVLVLGIALVTVTSQSVRAALTMPVKNLRSE